MNKKTVNNVENHILISVIVPILNTKKYIRECLDSIREQTLTDIEIICVDGGSTDGSLEVIKEYNKNDDRFIIVTDTKGSYGAQVNRGIELAKGDYVAIAEPDDYVDTKMYELLYKEAKKTGADIVRGDYVRFVGDKEDRLLFPKSACKKEWYGKDLNSLKEKDLLENTPANWSGIYKKSFLDEERIIHNTTKGAAYQDLGFWFITFALAKKIRFVPMTGYYYRIDNPNSSINSKNKESCLKGELSWLKKQLVERGLFEEYKEKYSRIEYIHTEWVKRKIEGLIDTECYKRIATSEDNSCIIFGCGADGVDYLMMLREEGLLKKIGYITDNDNKLWGNNMLGIQVVSPKEVINYYLSCEDEVKYFIISSTRYSEQIREQLTMEGVSERDIFQIGI